MMCPQHPKAQKLLKRCYELFRAQRLICWLGHDGRAVLLHLRKDPEVSRDCDVDVRGVLA